MNRWIWTKKIDLLICIRNATTQKLLVNTYFLLCASWMTLISHSLKVKLQSRLWQKVQIKWASMKINFQLLLFLTIWMILELNLNFHIFLSRSFDAWVVKFYLYFSVYGNHAINHNNYVYGSIKRIHCMQPGF